MVVVMARRLTHRREQFRNSTHIEKSAVDSSCSVTNDDDSSAEWNCRRTGWADATLVHSPKVTSLLEVMGIVLG